MLTDWEEWNEAWLINMIKAYLAFDGPSKFKEIQALKTQVDSFSVKASHVAGQPASKQIHKPTDRIPFHRYSSSDYAAYKCAPVKLLDGKSVTGKDRVSDGFRLCSSCSFLGHLQPQCRGTTPAGQITTFTDFPSKFTAKKDFPPRYVGKSSTGGGQSTTAVHLVDTGVQAQLAAMQAQLAKAEWEIWCMPWRS